LPACDARPGGSRVAKGSPSFVPSLRNVAKCFSLALIRWCWCPLSLPVNSPHRRRPSRRMRRYPI
jgi:hypothetical protein